MVAPFPAIIISKKRRHILNTFREAGATSPESARSVEDIGLSKSILLEIQKLEGVLIEVEQNRFYLDKIREKQVVHFRRTVMGLLIVIGIIFIWYFGK